MSKPRTDRRRTTRKRVRTEHQVSAGGLVVQDGHILLISTREGRRWQLPKGHVEPGESTAQAACREVQEETGITGLIVAPLPEIEYWFVERDRRRIHKRVHYFLLSYVRGSTEDYDPNEVSGAEWVPWEDGLARLSFANERKVALAARELLTARQAELIA